MGLNVDWTRGFAKRIDQLLLFRSSSGRILLVSDGADGTIRWDADSGRPLLHYLDPPYRAAINELAAAELPCGRLVLAAATDDGLIVWDTDSGEPLAEPDEIDTIWSVAAGTLPGGRVVFVGAANSHLLYLWDAATGQRLREPLTGHQSSVKAVATFALPDGGLGMASGGDDCVVRLWDAATGRQIAEPLPGDGWFTEVITVDLGQGRTMVAASHVLDDDLRVVHRWDVLNGEPIGTPLGIGRDEDRLSAARIRGRPRLISIDETGTLVHRDPITGERQAEPAIQGSCHAATTLPDGTTLIATACRDGIPTIHRIGSGV